MPETIRLSANAVALFRLHVERKGDIAVDDATREPYRELALAGLMVAGHSFTRGRESFYKLTDAGWERRFEFISPLRAESASPHS
jgi:hypothetical protein